MSFRYIGILFLRFLDRSNPNIGVKQIYRGGLNGGVRSSTEISHYCNPQREFPTHSYVQHRYENEEFVFEFKTESKYACLKK